ncbi:hypothetical protein J1614_001556 [Plenodomus biglobosus]|nr:hypothetical protein J1614_001556 [Plenodomus biglobosus]
MAKIHCLTIVSCWLARQSKSKQNNEVQRLQVGKRLFSLVASKLPALRTCYLFIVFKHMATVTASDGDPSRVPPHLRKRPAKIPRSCPRTWGKRMTIAELKSITPELKSNKAEHGNTRVKSVLKKTGHRFALQPARPLFTQEQALSWMHEQIALGNLSELGQPLKRIKPASRERYVVVRDALPMHKTTTVSSEHGAIAPLYFSPEYVYKEVDGYIPQPSLHVVPEADTEHIDSMELATLLQDLRIDTQAVLTSGLKATKDEEKQAIVFAQHVLQETFRANMALGKVRSLARGLHGLQGFRSLLGRAKTQSSTEISERQVKSEDAATAPAKAHAVVTRAIARMDWPEGWPAVKPRQVPPATFGAVVTNGLIDGHLLDPSRYHCTGLFSGGFCYYAFYRFMPCKHDRCHARHELEDGAAK